ncbi:MAG: bifunctional UDP-N-acetylglucosamine diphosphorylase/glucosamine-1-phosphate N-acetyltransferase GlmU [Rickettsiales bacterium]|nr:bifunctional UDP-N-acetylglucosamine diphosphorylase/glucosamine-1-phosphate N-acetyltransferase GlmU [Rickettsiales bacterium]
MSNLSIIIIAAGKGTRMKSSVAKHLHKIGNLEMVLHIIKTAEKLKAQEIVCVCSEENVEQIRNSIEKNITIIIQKERLGTAHAAKVGMEAVKNKSNDILVMYGDAPLVRLETYQKMIDKLNCIDIAQVGLIFKTKDICNKYGRVITIGDNLADNVEYKDANEKTRQSDLCNAAILAIKGNILKDFLKRIDNKNASGEYYLTDTIKLAKQDGLFSSFVIAEEDEVMGVNSRIDLAMAEKIFQDQKRKEFMEKGVTLIDPQSVYFSYDTEIENDVVVEPNVVFLSGVKIAKNVVIHSFSYLEDCIIEDGVSVGPFARIRPKTILKSNCHIGNFVEIKKSTVGEGTKIGHLTYIGDAIIGKETNIGAGCITCNYDGFNKFPTKIGDNCFVGSNTIMVAPVELCSGCLTAAGSIITKKVCKNDIAIGRADQTNLKGKAESYRKKRAKKK